jgi:hypothetical protein
MPRDPLSCKSRLMPAFAHPVVEESDVLMGAGRFALRCRSGACGCPCRCLTRLRAGRTCSAMFRQGRSFHKSCSCGQLTGLTPTLGHHHAGTLGMPLSGLSPQHVTVNTNALASRSCELPCVYCCKPMAHKDNEHTGGCMLAVFVLTRLGVQRSDWSRHPIAPHMRR